MSSITAYPGQSFSLTRRWRQALPALLLLLAWILFLYRDTATAMVLIWSRSETFTHGFLVPPIVFWLIWRLRHRVEAQVPRSMPVALLAIAVAAFVWLLGELAAVNAVTQLAFVTLLVLTVPTLLGWSVTRLLIFPLGFLFFAVPIGEFLLPQLMEWTANFTVFALRLSGIPVYREGLNFVIPSGNWSVVEACSGVRYLIASLTVGTLFAYLNYQSTKRRVLFVLVALIVPVVANWMRAYMIVMLGHLSGNKLAVGVDHLIYGWIFFGIVIMLMFIIGARWAEPEKPPDIRGLKASVVRRTESPVQRWTTIACLAVLVALPHVGLALIERGTILEPVRLNAPTTLAENWQLTPSPVVDFKPSFQNPSAEFNNTYTSQGQVVGLYVGYYRHQDYSRKLVSSNNVVLVNQDPQWAWVTRGSRTVLVGDKEVAIRTAELRGAAHAASIGESRLVVWQLYWINGTVTANEYLAKAYGALYQLLGRGDDAAVIVVYSPKDQAGGADAMLTSFMASNYAAINALLVKTRQAGNSPRFDK